MAIAIAQQVVSGAALDGTSSTTITATITPSAGSTLFVFVRGAATGGTMTCSDPTNGSYSQIDGRALLTNMKGWTFYKAGVAGSAVTITATWSSATVDRGMIVLEITGSSGAAPDTSLSASVVGSGTGTDVLTTGNMTPTGQPALVVGVYSDFGGATISAGTGYTGGTGRWTASGDSTLPEWQRITSTSGIAATWTPGSSTNGIMMGAIFREASSGVTGTGSAAMAPFAASSSGTETFTGTGSAALKSFGASGAGDLALPAVSGLKLWLRGEFPGVSQSGGNVTAWADQSGNGNHTTNVGTVPFVSSSINGKPGVTCQGNSGLQNLTSSPVAAGGARTIYAVIKGSSEYGGGIYCNYRSSHTQELWMMGATGSIPGILYASDGTTYQKIPTPVLMRPQIVRAAVAGSAGALASVTINGVVQTVTPISSTFVETGSAGFGVGILPYFTSAFGWQGDICEVVVYDSVLSAGNDAAVLAYLAARYGIVLGSGSAATSPFGASGSGTETFSGSGSAAAKSFGAAGAGTETFTGTGSAALSPFGVSGAGSVGGAVGTGSAAMKPFGVSGSGTVTFNYVGSGSVALSRFGVTGAGFTGPPETPLTPPFTTVVDPVTLSTWVDSVVLTALVDPVRLTLGQRLKPRMTTDTYPITNTLMNNGAPVNLSGYTVTINIVTQDRATVKRANGACTVTDAANGRVSYTPSSGDVDTAGSYYVQWKAVSGSGTPYHFPQDGYEPLEIQSALG